MKITSTGTHNIDIENIDRSKIDLSNKIMKAVFPLLDDLSSSKLNELNSLKSELNKKTKKIKNEKLELQDMVKKYQRQKKVKKLLERISKIVLAGLANSGSYRHETIILLKVIGTLSDDKLNYHLSETLKTINKRFSVLL